MNQGPANRRGGRHYRVRLDVYFHREAEVEYVVAANTRNMAERQARAKLRREFEGVDFSPRDIYVISVDFCLPDGREP
jgi:hypothetical protein